MKYLFVLVAGMCLLLTKQGRCQDTLRANTAWNAQWIGVNILFDKGTTYGVYYFRKSIDVAGKPSKFIIHVSADNRYKLYVNGKLASVGPTRGDFYNWNYNTVDIAKYLKAGKNSIAAVVWNEADLRPEYQSSLRSAFIVQGNTAAEEVINTNGSWKCVQDKAFDAVWGYFVAINGQKVDMNKTITDWHTAAFDDSKWPTAASLFAGQPKGFTDGFGYMLVPSPLPAMEMTYQPITEVRQVAGMDVPNPIPKKVLPLTIPANKKVMILLDQTYETNAYVTLKFSQGQGAGLSVGYAESLFDYIPTKGMRKSNRNDVAGKDFRGLTDTITSNGKAGQAFTTFNFRTYRYLRLYVQTKNSPLVIDSLYGTFTGYPFKQPSVFSSDNTEIQKILDIGWRTARLNAFETYTDCPYYEQLQYIGDTRIQALVTYFNSADDRLPRYALNLMDHSRLPEGVTLSRYPSHTTQIISTFSLWYIGMLHDYWMYRSDADFVKNKLTGCRAIMEFFAKYQQPDGSLKNTPYWTFVDWVGGTGWRDGAAPKGSDGSSAIVDLQLLWAYQWAAAMEAKIGSVQYAALYAGKATKLQQTIQSKYWDSGKKLFADTKEKNTFSQHANALALLTNMVADEDMPAFGKRLLNTPGLTQCTIYFKYYLHQALVKAGLGDDYLNWLDVWRNNINMGLTTWAETSDLNNTRSDCHAWGCSPNIEFFRSVLGIDSDAAGFKKVKIEPHLGTLTNASGEIPHPNGKILVAYVLKDSKWKIGIDLPQNTSGTFVWKGKTYPLKAGENIFVI
ncbi:alpha-rhamnosidase [Mucilaginibacter hurinus]|uniref:Alpha-rhamnosidase n=1 Tax=Mucilaginibacter hurinus TaxID=2201324 RepID=A0A367GQM1_9SPHI|nr:alpha-L-rhamnosidase N-terminal domain-containing protein [Mucilaginibacter hurinus]RCH55166.1 alpha-rhamnosidase [Mucilaginibacter hurinus]